jgi:flagella basal body P-ring formation protein FlgA
VLRAVTDAAGKETRRALKAGEIIRASDLKRPTLVAKGSNVTMLFVAPGMQLTSTGRALEDGGQGDSITVLNPTSYRKVEAVVVKAGTVRVGALGEEAGKLAEDIARAKP